MGNVPEAVPGPSSIYGQDSDSSAFDWFCVADQSQSFSHSRLERKVSGLAQSQQAGHRTRLK